MIQHQIASLMISTTSITVATIAALATQVVAQEKVGAQEKQQTQDSKKVSEASCELGAVEWSHDLDAARKVSAKTEKPVFLLFQEVPGCQTCQNFGKGPLSHPLLVEAIEDLFVPVMVYNNRKGKDAEILSSFSEKSWNNPVVRYLDSESNDVIERKGGVYSTSETAARMVASLKKAKRTVPDYLNLLASAPTKTETAVFAMHCYWEGEGKLGAIKGVVDTKAAWLQRKEVVEVEYDPAVVDYKTLLATAQKMECATTVFSTSESQYKTASKATEDVVRLKDDEKLRWVKESEQKYYLKNSPLKHLPLTVTQATQINAALGPKLNAKAAEKFLSPRQAKLLTQVKKAIEKDSRALSEMVTPRNDQDLAQYQTRLVKKIASVLKD